MSSNPYTKLLGLMPQRPLLVGDVLVVEDGVATIEMPGGGIMRARGLADVADRVFFRDGAIEGPAPTLDYVEIDV